MTQRAAELKAEGDALANESAPWFGRTGLPEEVERHVAAYVRMEFGEVIGDHDSLKASDLDYVGAFHEGSSIVHYWLVPSSQAQLYAHVEVKVGGGTYTSMGERRPPE